MLGPTMHDAVLEVQVLGPTMHDAILEVQARTAMCVPGDV